ASPTRAVHSWAPAQPPPPAVEVGPYTPAGPGPSNPPSPTTIAPPVPGLSVPGLAVPGLDPPPATPGTPFPGPVQNPFASSRSKGRMAAVVAVAIVVATALIAFFVLGSSAGASDLKMKFTPGETHTYQLELTMTGRGGSL